GERTMKRVISLTAFTLLFALSTTGFAQPAGRPAAQSTFASDFQTVPVMGNTPGFGGATFQTYVAIFNPTASSFSVNVSLYDTAGVKRDAVITLAAGELKTYQNFLAEVFQYTGGGSVTFKSPSPANRFILSTAGLSS